MEPSMRAKTHKLQNVLCLIHLKWRSQNECQAWIEKLNKIDIYNRNISRKLNWNSQPGNWPVWLSLHWKFIFTLERNSKCRSVTVLMFLLEYAESHKDPALDHFCSPNTSADRKWTQTQIHLLYWDLSLLCLH